ncbi:DUF4138 domain-containing protein [Mucilaginibacter conchicola]|uniref:DUF4138 domain-containing protein n=1 Tax=Mucilaginibacter conchicola TaxID=2303333 RepID=A0A372NRV0_9SPHI|nr:DUF4138 domain-containing protein [Mucilaginibacter conchicola]RFZ91075.1 DUF4138 domain-containing protein [Mucilaginibacter conchicola]
MKKFLFYLAALCPNFLLAQPAVTITKNQTIHFISPEPIQYADISARTLAGDLPLKNVFRLRIKDSASAFTGAIVTIAGEKFIAQYRIVRSDSAGPSQIEISPSDTRPLDISGIGFSENQLRSMALNLISRKPEKHLEKEKAFGLTGQLNHVYTAGDYLFLDISYKNNTRLRYEIDELRFRVDDRKVTKASNVQSFELKPVLMLFKTPVFSKSYRNIFVFKKLSFSGNKVMLAELSEKQVSGRVLILKIKWQDILDADTLPN